jgi:hypothetical protein
MVRKVNEAVLPLARLFGTLPEDAAEFGAALGRSMQMAGVQAEINNEKLQLMAQRFQDISFEASDTITKLATQESYYKRAGDFFTRLRERAKEFGKSVQGGADAVRQVATQPVAVPEVKVDKDAEKKRLERIARAEEEFNRARLAADQTLEDQRLRLAIAEGDKRAELRKEQIDLQRAQADELATLQDAHEAKLELLRAQGASEIAVFQEKEAQKLEIAEQLRLQEAERSQQLIDQDRAIQEQKLENLADLAQGTSQLFTDLYEVTGKKQKEFFYAAKAASIAEATINIAQAVTKALAQGGFFGIATAAVVGAMGAVQIAKIAGQGLAEGGLVHGSSPSDTADNVPIRATAGEYMQPVSSVRHYGLGVMEAIRQKAVPKDVMSRFSVPRAPRSMKTNFQEGGEIPSGNGGLATGQQKQTNIINVLDPAVFDQWSASAAGQRNILNAMSENIFEVRQMVFDNQD